MAVPKRTPHLGTVVSVGTASRGPGMGQALSRFFPVLTVTVSGWNNFPHSPDEAADSERLSTWLCVTQ